MLTRTLTALLWLPVCLFVSSAMVNYIHRPPGNVIAVMPRYDGVRWITDQRRRPPATQHITLGFGAVLWLGLCLSPLRRRTTLAASSLACCVLSVEAAEPLRRWRLTQELAAVPDAPPLTATYPRFHRGVSFVRDGWNAYHPAPTAAMLDELKQLGVDSIAVVPYGIYRQGESTISLGRESTDEPLYSALIRLAHARGIHVMLKPQLWVMPGMFPGAIRIADDAQRKAWFSSYRTFILHWAAIAERAHADLFVVGTELEHLSTYEQPWREIVRDVRTSYHGRITYAANHGPDFEKLTWWDALDYIGLNEYYPLDDSLDFTPIIARVSAIQQRYAKPVILTEVGFSSVATAHREPWSEPALPVDLEHQRRCYEALLKAFWPQPWFAGMYWWKIGADGRGGPQDRSLTPWRKPAMDAVSRYYRSAR